MHVAHDMLVDILSHKLTKLLVRIVVVGRIVCLVPRRVTEGMSFAIHLRVTFAHDSGQGNLLHHAQSALVASVFIPFSIAGLTIVADKFAYGPCEVLMQNPAESETCGFTHRCKVTTASAQIKQSSQIGQVVGCKQGCRVFFHPEEGSVCLNAQLAPGSACPKHLHPPLKSEGCWSSLVQAKVRKMSFSELAATSTASTEPCQLRRLTINTVVSEQATFSPVRRFSSPYSLSVRPISIAFLFTP